MSKEYKELTEEEKTVVDNYIKTVDFQNPQLINEIEKNEVEKLNYKLGILIGITSNEENEEILNDIKRLIEENKAHTEKKILLSLFKKLRNRPKVLTSKKSKEEKQKEAEVLPEKLEMLRSEFRIKSAKISIISERWIEQYKDIQYKIMAFQQIEKSSDKSIKERIRNSINYFANISLIIENQILTCVRFAKQYETMASNYESSQVNLFATNNIENIIENMEKVREEAKRLSNNIETGLNQNVNIENSDSENVEEER